MSVPAPGVRLLAAADVAAAAAIAAGLPDYFTADVPGKIEIDAARHGGWVVTADEAVAGFAIVARKSAHSAEILWMAVDATRRGRGYGTTLVGHVLDELRREGISVVEVKTLDRSASYEPYEATRGFWEGNGFVQVDSVDPWPDWQPGSPAAIYVAALRATR